MRVNERQLRKLQKQRHMYDIRQMILANPIFKNLGPKDQRTLEKLVYRAEMIEVFMRDRSLVKVNNSFDEIIEGIVNMLDQTAIEDEDDGRPRDQD